MGNDADCLVCSEIASVVCHNIPREAVARPDEWVDLQPFPGPFLPRVILPAFTADQKSGRQTAQLTEGSKMEIPVDALPAVLEPLG
jgi:hypothetical protein